MEIRPFLYVNQIAECGSMTKAAAALFITQPALSNYISKLEEELGNFKKVRESNDAAQIKSAMDAFSQATYAIFGKVYQQQNPQGGDPNGAQGGYTAGNANDDGTVESDFTDNK